MKMGGYYVMDREFWFYKMKGGMEVDSGDDCRTM